MSWGERTTTGLRFPGSSVYELPCPFQPDTPKASLPCLWQGNYTQKSMHTLQDIVNQTDLTFTFNKSFGHRSCAETAAGTKSPWNTWRTDEPKCVISATVSFARMVIFCLCIGERNNLKQSVMTSNNHNTSINNSMSGFKSGSGMVEAFFCSADGCWIYDI